MFLYKKLFLIFQILNRTNNIFELVSVEAILPDQPQDKTRIPLSDDSDILIDEKNLRLKGDELVSIWIFCLIYKYVPFFKSNIFQKILKFIFVSVDDSYYRKERY